MSTQTTIPTCAENGCSKPCSVKMVGAKESEDWGNTDYSNHKYHWNLCDECYEEEQEEEPRMNCVDCDYSLCEGEFNSGKGRIMFNDVNDDGTKYRCGCCDDRVADPQGMFPDEEEEEIEEFNSDKLDNILYPDGLDWTFEKPTKGKYHTIYIIKKEEEEE